MLKEWQFNVLFFVGVGGAVLLLIGPELGMDIEANGTTVTGVGAILAYILTQKNSFTKNGHKNDEDKDGEGGKHKRPLLKRPQPPKKEVDDDGTA